jgi:hypothetical protein
MKEIKITQIVYDINKMEGKEREGEKKKRK